MRKILVTTESCSDLTQELKERYNINIVPMHIVFPKESFQDGTIPVEYVYEYFNKTKDVPKTSAVNPAEFTMFFDRLSEENGGAEILHIGYSSQCSSTFQNAVIGVRDCQKAKVHLVDSRNVSGGAGNLVLIVSKLLEENPEITGEQLAKKAEEMVPRISTCFVPERLEYLVAGGRVSNAMAIGATLLKIRPRIDIVEGKLIATKKYRGSMQRIVEKLTKEFIEGQDLLRDVIYLIYVPGAQMDVVEQTKETFFAYGFKEVILIKTGCVMSTHGGPGAIGISAIRRA